MTAGNGMRWALAVTLVALAVGVIVLGGPRAGLSQLAAARAFAQTHRLEAAALYVAAYVGFAALALPGAWAMSVAGGVVFGTALGFALALIGSGLGATAAMLAARYLLRDAARRRFPGTVARARAGGARWIVAARLAPVVPFFAVNLAAGVTDIPAGVFAAASAIGSAPLAALYAFAGARLDGLRSPSDALSPGVVAGLTGLGLMILVARPLARRWAARLRPPSNSKGAEV